MRSIWPVYSVICHISHTREILRFSSFDHFHTNNKSARAQEHAGNLFLPLSPSLYCRQIAKSTRKRAWHQQSSTGKGCGPPCCEHVNMSTHTHFFMVYTSSLPPIRKLWCFLPSVISCYPPREISNDGAFRQRDTPWCRLRVSLFLALIAPSSTDLVGRVSHAFVVHVKFPR